MTLTKLVNGVRINLPPEEEADTRARWDANQQATDDYQRDFSYLDRRREEYPPVVEQLEAIYAGFKKMQDDGASLDPLTASWVAQIEGIHATNPPPA